MSAHYIIPSIDNEYCMLKNHYDNVLNLDNALIETSNDEPTPIDCVEQMVKTIPEEFWKNPHVRILDPCVGCGNFPFVIYHKLKKYHTKKHILENMLYFNDINTNRLQVLRHIFNNDKLNINTGDFLKYQSSGMFDLVVANPPYAKLLPNGKRASKNHNLIGLFIAKSFELLNPGGYLLYITPDNWMSFADRNTLIKDLTSKQIHYLNIHQAKKYFKKIGSSFVYYLIENTPYYKDMVVEGIWKKKTYIDNVPSMTRSFIPLFYNSIVKSILQKTVDSAHETFNVETSSDLHKYTKRDLIVATQDDEHPYKLIHTPKQTVWSSRPHKFQDGYKVFISTTTYYSAFVDNCGMTQSIAFIQCENEQRAQEIKKVLEHPLYTFINNICRYGNFNNIRILQSLPYCDDYDRVYDMFDITEKEKNMILDNL